MLMVFTREEIGFSQDAWKKFQTYSPNAGFSWCFSSHASLESIKNINQHTSETKLNLPKKHRNTISRGLLRNKSKFSRKNSRIFLFIEVLSPGGMGTARAAAEAAKRAASCQPRHPNAPNIGMICLHEGSKMLTKIHHKMKNGPKKSSQNVGKIFPWNIRS